MEGRSASVQHYLFQEKRVAGHQRVLHWSVERIRSVSTLSEMEGQ